MMKYIAVIGMAVLLAGAVASAEVVDGSVVGAVYQVEITKTAGVGTVENLDRYTFTLLDQGQSTINALEVLVTGSGVHHEQLDLYGTQTITPTINPMFGQSGIDTLALVDSGVYDKIADTWVEPLVSGASSAEPKSGDLGAPPTITGYGSPLTGASARAGSDSLPMDVLQVVAQTGTVFNWYIRAADAGVGEEFEGEIPEPATMSLLALGGLALIRRRRS